MSDRIPIPADEAPGDLAAAGHGMLPGVPRVAAVALDVVQQGIRSVLGKAARAVGAPELDGAEWRIAEVKLSLAIDATGQVSLLSAARGQVGARATLDVTLLWP